MVKHIILWKLKEELTSEQKAEVKNGIKKGLEGLNGIIPGMISAEVNINNLPSSNADVMLDSSFENNDCLKAYQADPRHNAVANQFVRPFVATRLCLDYEV